MKRFIIFLTILCSAFAVALCACNIVPDFIVGDTYTTVYGIALNVEYEGVTVKAEDDVYNLNIGNIYTTRVSLIQGGGSTPSGICGDCVTFESDGGVGIAYAGDDTNEGETLYSLSGTIEGTSIITAYMDKYSCSITVNWVV